MLLQDSAQTLLKAQRARVECFFKVAAKTGTSNTHLIKKSDNSLIRRQTVNMML